MPISSTSPDTADALLRALAQIALLKLTVEKLTLQLLKARRAQFGSSSEQLDRQIALIEGEPLDEQRAAAVAAKAAANRESVDRSLPSHLPREEHVHRPEATNAQHDAAGQACGCTACGGRLRRIGRT